MELVILCCLAFTATVAAWMYLNVQKPKAYEKDDVETAEEGERSPLTESEETDRPLDRVFIKPKGKRVAFLIVMFLTLCGETVAINCLFESNSLLDNAKLLTLLSVLFVAANVDARHRIIPNALVLVGLIARIVFWIIELIVSIDAFWNVFKSDLLACLLVVAFFVIGVFIVKGGIGMGDVKLMLIMCLFQGFYGVVSSLFCSLFVAFVYALGVLFLKKKTKKDSVAFAPAILLGTALSMILTGM